jgi:hypothetical protein
MLPPIRIPSRQSARKIPRRKQEMAEQNTARDARMDPNDLWREDVFTDRKVGTIRMLSPVRADGGADPARQVQFVGEAQMMTNMGALPISFEIEAATLGEAAQRYGDAAKVAFERAVRELQDLRRQAASSLVIPPAGGFGPGGMPGGGGGKIQLP